MRKEQLIGVLLIITAIGLMGLFIAVQNSLSDAADQVLQAGGDCTAGGTCLHEQAANFVLIGAIPSLIILLSGIYIAFFLEVSEYKIARSKDERFNLILTGLDGEQQEAMKKIREDDGVSQATLKYRVSMSKSKLSQVLTELEERELISRTPDGKTKRIHLRV